MKKLYMVAVLGFSLIAQTALAADAQLSWTQPTQNTDGSSIPASGAGAIASNRIEWGTCSGTAFGTKAGEKVVQPVATSTTITGLAVGTYCFRAYATNTYGVESGPSNVASKTFTPPVPQPPSIVTVSQVAYDLRFKGIRVALVEVGNVPLGVVCGEHVFGNFYRLSQDLVTLNKRVKGALVGKCEAKS